MTIQEFIIKIDGMLMAALTNTDISFIMCKDLERQIKSRAFNVHGGKDSEGKLLPAYKSEAYRIKKKKVAKNWDLQDTLALSKSIAVTSKMGKKETSLVFVDSVNKEKAASLERRAGAEIFTPGDKEINMAVKQATRMIVNKVMKPLLK